MSCFFARYRPPLVRPRHPLPLIRSVSCYATWFLARTPATANVITALSLAFGLAGAWCLARGGYDNDVIWLVLIIVCYVFDNSDGEIARIKDQSSTFGMHFDTFVDFIVHAAIFLAIGVGHGRLTGIAAWDWLCWIAAAAMLGNYLSGVISDYQARRRNEIEDPTGQRLAEAAIRPTTAREGALFVFREAFRADFCFILLVFALPEQVWFLLPAGAIGAPVYWLTSFFSGADKFHV